jgi:hypothetical protein
MIKPYHEKVIARVRQWMQHPHQGWAEMTNQALFNAAGIGHLHQKVHVDEHNMGAGHEKEPALVVHLQPGYKDVASGGRQSFGGEENRAALRKIALMDFLGNNLDRHAGNLMIHSESGAPLAVDHSRNFQYKAERDKRRAWSTDTFLPYLQKSSIGGTDPEPSPRSWEEKQAFMERYAPAFEWWGEQSPKVRETFNQRLNQIQDPHVREHLKRNFEARADWLDERARFGLENYGANWAEDTIPIYKPDQMTDEQADDPEYTKEHIDRIRAKRSGQW